VGFSSISPTVSRSIDEDVDTVLGQKPCNKNQSAINNLPLLVAVSGSWSNNISEYTQRNNLNLKLICYKF